MATERSKNRDGITWVEKLNLYQARVTVGYKDGKQVRKAVYGKSYAECREKLTALRREIDEGKTPTDGRLTVEKFLKDWLTTAVKPKVRENTYLGYRNAVEKHIIPEIGKTALVKLTPRDVERMLTRIAAKVDGRKGRGAQPLSTTQVNYCRVVLRAALNRAMKWGMVYRNVAALADAPERKGYEKKPLTAEEATAFLRAVADDRLAPLYTVAIALGLRKGEILGLQWQDVDLKAGTLTVAMQMQRVGGVKRRVPTKTDLSRRTIALPPFVADALRQHKKRQNQERLVAGSHWQDTGLVFCTATGTPLEASNLSRAFLAALARTGTRRVRFHDLRHTAATLLQTQGVEYKVISDILGHSRISTTMDMYVKTQEAQHREAAAKMNALLG